MHGPLNVKQSKQPKHVAVKQLCVSAIYCIAINRPNIEPQIWTNYNSMQYCIVLYCIVLYSSLTYVYLIHNRWVLSKNNICSNSHIPTASTLQLQL